MEMAGLTVNRIYKNIIFKCLIANFVNPGLILYDDFSLYAPLSLEFKGQNPDVLPELQVAPAVKLK